MTRLVATGSSVSYVAKLLGVSWITVKYHTSKAFREDHKSKMKNVRYSDKQPNKPVYVAPAPDREDLTGRVFGDPPPGRSALDQRARPAAMTGYGTVEL